MTADKVAEFKKIVRGMTFEQAAEMLRTIDRKQSEQADWMREILHTRFPELAYNPAANVRTQAEYLESAAQRQQLDTLQKQVEALQTRLSQTPHYTPTFPEPAPNDYTPMQKAVFVIVVGVTGTAATAHFFGPAIIAAFGAVLNAVPYGIAICVAALGLRIVFSGNETPPESAPMDAPFIINQTVVFNNGKDRN